MLTPTNFHCRIKDLSCSAKQKHFLVSWLVLIEDRRGGRRLSLPDR